MRFATAVLAALAAPALASTEAPVWTFDKASDAKISAEHARVVLAHRLGLSAYHELATADPTTITLLNNVGAPQKMFESEEASRKLLVVVEGLEDARALMEDSPSFYISDAPSSSDNEKLVLDLLEQDAHRRGTKRCGGPGKFGDVAGGLSAREPAGACTVGAMDASWDRVMPAEKLAAMMGDVDAMSLVYHTALPPTVGSDLTGLFHITTLEDAARKFGTKSAEYSRSLDDIRQVLATARGNYDQATVVGMPLVTRFAKRDGMYGSYEMPALAVRKEQPLSAPAPASSSAAPKAQATSPANSTIPKTTIPSCWSSESACTANTASCSGHGSCKKKYAEKESEEETGAECWTCMCEPTVIQSGSSVKTIYWGGPACQKKDISVPFFLFAGFTIAAVTAISYGIGMLYSIGQEDLPSVLGSGVAPTVRK